MICIRQYIHSVTTIYTAHLAHGTWWAETVDCEPPTYRNWGMVKEGMRAALNRVSQMSHMHSLEQTRNRFTLSADIHTTVQRYDVYSFHCHLSRPYLIGQHLEFRYIIHYRYIKLPKIYLSSSIVFWACYSFYYLLIVLCEKWEARING